MLSAYPWILPLIPAVAAVIVLLFGRHLPMRGASVSIGSLVANVVLSGWLDHDWIVSDRHAIVGYHVWFILGSTQVTAGTMVDGLTAVMLGTVSVISLLVQIYSAEYMKLDSRFTHFFAILTLFTAAMEWFVVSANTLQMVFGWEVMALCSFLLIGHWWEEKSNVHAAMKAFLTTRASDTGLLVGVAILFFAAGRRFDIITLNQGALDGTISHQLLLAGAIALFVAVIGKSAQFPLHTWLPDAMAGPTPMSALIHAATMVVAGVFLIARLFPVFAKGFSIGALAQTAGGVNPIALIGAITIVIAALLAFVQHDIKKLLSYSTVSQLGYMVMALGCGAWTAAIFHLFTHAFFKALLFLAAGSVGHGVHGFNIDEDMGGLRKHMPITHATFAIGTFCLIGVVPFSGFWSKEQITTQAGAGGYHAFVVVSLIGTLLTAAYMIRCYYRVFWGRFRGRSQPHESPLAITLPCVALAVLSLASGFLQAPALGIDVFHRWVEPSFITSTAEPAGLNESLIAELLVLAVGVLLVWLAYLRGVGPRSLARRFTFARGVYVILANHYYLDALYHKVFVQGIRRVLAWFVQWVDHNVIDNTVDAIGSGAVWLGRTAQRHIDQEIVGGFVRDTGAVAVGTGGLLARLQNGRIQRYVVLMLGAVTAVTIVLVTRG